MDTTRTLVVCSKCGRCATFATLDEARSAGWLVANRAGNSDRMVIRCPEHAATGYARAQAGLPQQKRTRRVMKNLGRGLWVRYGGDCVAVAGQIDDGDGDLRYILDFHRGEMPAFKHEIFNTIDQLIAAMRKIEPDLRKWRLVK